MIQTCDTPSLLPVAEAISAILSQLTPLASSEKINLLAARNRVLAKAVVSNIQVPPADNSAMDGYAMRHEDLQNQNSLALIGTALAGQPFIGQVKAGQCVRIMTGAIIPDGADSVVMQENTEANEDSILFKQIPNKGNSVRKAGEDIQLGQVVIEKGIRLTAAHLALIASIGLAEVEVNTKLKVAIIATGDELTPVGQPLATGAIYESNRYALQALLEDYPVEIVDYGIVKDDKNALREAFTKADQNCDLVLSCGGVSVGDADYVKDILQELGEINFWKVAIKPGKPFAFGKLKHAWFCGLPGNPVSSYVTFQQLVCPLLEKLAGQQPSASHYFIAKAAQTIYKRPGRADYQRGIFYRDEAGELWVKPNGKQGSGIMSSIANANCYMLLPQGSSNVNQGQSVKIMPF